MARIIRCPSCGALWRLEGAAEENYLCSACGREFSAASAQTVEVDDQALDAALAELKAKKSEAAQAAPRQPMTEPRFATKVAQELNTPTTAEKNEPPAQFDEKEAGRGAPMPAIYRTKKSGLGSFLLFVCILLCAAVGAACAFLMMHQFVLSQAPYVRPMKRSAAVSHVRALSGQMLRPSRQRQRLRLMRLWGSLSPRQLLNSPIRPSTRRCFP